MARPVIYVLAGVNGAGKSSVGGHLLNASGASWYNPDTFARELRVASGCDQATANAVAWQEGMRRLESAIQERSNYAFETTLGGKTVTATLLKACATHDVLIWYCGLATPELHLERVHARVRAGGHDIPEEKIRERYVTSRYNLVRLMPHAADIRVFDNSAPAGKDGTVSDPVLVLAVQRGKIRYPAPRDQAALSRTPDWAKPLVEAAIRLRTRKKKP